jgi:hypothetical protein
LKEELANGEVLQRSAAKAFEIENTSEGNK